MVADRLPWFRGRSATFLICALLFILGFGVRLLGIGWGLKNEIHNGTYHPDEVQIFDYAHKSHVYRGPKESEYYNYGTLYYAILRAADFLGVTFDKLPRPASLELSDVQNEYQWDQLNAYASQAIKWGRYAAALFGAATAALIFLILRRFTTTLGSLAGASLIAFGSPAHVEHSRFQTVDTISLFMLALGTLVTLRLLRPELTGVRRWAAEVALAGLIAGFAASTRYSDAFLLLPIWAALALRRPKGWWWMAPMAGVCSIIGFIITTPGSVTDTDYFLSNLEYQMNHVNSQLTVVFVGRPVGYVYHIELMMIGISYIACTLGLLGILYAGIKLHYWALVVLAFFIPYYISIGRLQVMYLRYDFPLYIGVAIGFGYVISAIQLRSNSRWIAAAVAALALIGVESYQSGIRGVYQYTAWMMGPDPRDQAGEYLHQMAALHPGLEVGLVANPYFTTPAVLMDADYIHFQSLEIRSAMLRNTHDPHIVGVNHRVIPPYVTYSSYEFEDSLRLRNTPGIPEEFVETSRNFCDFYDWLHSVYVEDKVYAPDSPPVHDMQYVRPTVYVLKRRDLPW